MSHAPVVRAARAGLPINLATGNTYITQTDISVPGINGGLNLTRTWNSKWPGLQGAYKNSGLFGGNWRCTYDDRVYLATDSYIKYLREDGSFWSFGAGTTLVAPAAGGARLETGTTYWVITFKNGEKRVFDAVRGSLLSIIDRNGNTTQLSYDETGRLVMVTDPALRHLYFHYFELSPYLVQSITSDVGLATAYEYDNYGRLTRVTGTDNHAVTFEYDGQSMITAVRDADGTLLESHTYDSANRGTSSSRANGVESLTIDYWPFGAILSQ